MLIEITQEEYKKLQELKIQSKFLLRAVLEAGELNYYKEADSLDYDNSLINAAMRLIYPDEFEQRVKELLREEEEKHCEV